MTDDYIKELSKKPCYWKKDKSGGYFDVVEFARAIEQAARANTCEHVNIAKQEPVAIVSCSQPKMVALGASGMVWNSQIVKEVMWLKDIDIGSLLYLAPQPSIDRAPPAEQQALTDAEIIQVSNSIPSNELWSRDEFMLAFARTLLSKEPKVLDGWQPISTAPKDGTYIIVSNKYGTWIARYFPLFQSGFKPDNPWQNMMLNCDHIKNRKSSFPTHWMPLPAAPTAPKEPQ